MSQLPSGRHVALVKDPIFALVREGDLGTVMTMTLHMRSPEDLAPLLNIAYFNPVEGQSGPGLPYLSELMLSDIGTEKCNWPSEDVAFFQTWLASDVAQQWLQNTFDELTELIHSVKTKLPENLHGILDADD